MERLPKALHVNEDPLVRRDLEASLSHAEATWATVGGGTPCEPEVDLSELQPERQMRRFAEPGEDC
jgi:hypothetical protein